MLNVAAAAGWLVVLMLTFSDGSVVQDNDGKWDVAPTEQACHDMLKLKVQKLREKYEYQTDPKPSTIWGACLSPESKELDK